VLFLHGADEVEVPAGAFVVYLGTHGDRGAHRADVILPGAAYTEKSSIYVNTEGRPQLANRAAFPPGDAREDWAILRALSDALGAKLPYDTLADLRRVLMQAHPHLGRIDQIAPADGADIKKLAERGGNFDKAPFRSPVTDFYLTNSITRASAIMAECSALAAGRIPQAAGTAMTRAVILRCERAKASEPRRMTVAPSPTDLGLARDRNYWWASRLEATCLARPTSSGSRLRVPARMNAGCAP
jgi:NADH dehydrogenase/NADH:ubiquinone oxidoreductase subunit G